LYCNITSTASLQQQQQQQQMFRSIASTQQFSATVSIRYFPPPQFTAAAIC
jgi:hypothetical protein